MNGVNGDATSGDYCRRQIDLPLRVGEWTLMAPVKQLLVDRRSVLEPARHGGAPRRHMLSAQDDGFMCVVPADDASAVPRRLGLRNGLIYRLADCSVRHYVDLSGDFDSYLRGFSGKTRNGLRRKVRRFTRTFGEPALRVYACSESDFEDFFKAARRVSSETYQELMFDAGLPADAEAIAELRSAFLEGRSRGYVLFADSEPAAYLYCPRVGKALEYQFVGFRPCFRDYSPGTVLLMLVFERLFGEREIEMFDFGEGSHADGYKAFFATHGVDFQIVFSLRATLTNALLLTGQWLCDRVSEIAGAVLLRLGLKHRVRALMRRLRGVGRVATSS